jgi:DNA polymerase III alpha subunit
MDVLIEELEQKLDSFDSAVRKEALSALCEKVRSGEISLPEPGTDVNLHCHTFFSYNTYGYSPSKFAWLARRRGLAFAGVVDFDVLDALEEFLEAAKELGLKGCAGMETRVFVPEFSDRVINSPGEPGISYHMGVGFPTSTLQGKLQDFLLNLRRLAQQRNRDLMGRVNQYLKPVELDYEKDVLVLTPSGNPTERHVCLAYARKAREMFDDDNALQQFWSEKLGVDIKRSDLPQGRELLNTIRAKTMKRGGVGYVLPDKGSFPLMADTNHFILAAGGIPTVTWLDGAA